MWGKRNEDGKGSGQHDFTSLLGSDKKKLLKDLPDKLKECIHLKTCQEVKDIPVWESFHELYKIITNINSSNTPFDQYFEMARKCVIKFTSLREKRLGYTWAAITYTVKPDTGQPVEKNNDSARKVVLRNSNKKDVAADVFKLVSRQWQLQQCEHTKRLYLKHNLAYRDSEIKWTRRRDDNLSFNL